MTKYKSICSFLLILFYFYPVNSISEDLCSCDGSYFEVGERPLNTAPSTYSENPISIMEHHQLIECSGHKIVGSAGFQNNENGESVIFEDAINNENYKPYNGTTRGRRYVHTKIMNSIIEKYVSEKSTQCSIMGRETRASESWSVIGNNCQRFVKNIISAYHQELDKCKGVLNKIINISNLKDKISDLTLDLSDIEVEDHGKKNSFVCLVQKKYVHTFGSRSGVNSIGCLKNGRELSEDKKKWEKNIKSKIIKAKKQLEKMEIPSMCVINNDIPITDCNKNNINTNWLHHSVNIKSKINDLEKSISSSGVDKTNKKCNVPYYNIYVNGKLKGTNKMGCSGELELNGVIGKMKRKIKSKKIELKAYEYYLKKCSCSIENA